MKLILSRKGFDTGSGGCPSPFFPDGAMLALPIPDHNSMVRYRDVRWNGRHLGEVLDRLPGAKVGADDRAHLDPDLRADAVERRPGWKPVFGQHGSARGHLQKQGVGPGDLFLFFGLFREVADDGAFVPGRAARHVIWGWMQIGEILPVDANRATLGWAGNHPHLARGADPTNVLLVAADRLRLPGIGRGAVSGAAQADRLGESRGCLPGASHGDLPSASHASLPGAGVFPRFVPALQLTAPGAAGASTWRLSKWFHSDGGRSTLSYHLDRRRWTRDGDGVLLRTVGRGQEFVIDAGDHPEAGPWIAHLMKQGLAPARSAHRADDPAPRTHPVARGREDPRGSA